MPSAKARNLDVGAARELGAASALAARAMASARRSTTIGAIVRVRALHLKFKVQFAILIAMESFL